MSLAIHCLSVRVAEAVSAGGVLGQLAQADETRWDHINGREVTPRSNAFHPHVIIYGFYRLAIGFRLAETRC